MNTRLLLIHALSPIHAGTGQSIGAIDLAIARDRATDHPCLPGSSLKGALRDVSVRAGRNDTIKVFGPETTNAADHAGAFAIGDANLLLLPVRSVSGTFAYATSPFLLARFARDAKETGQAVFGIPSLGNVGECIVSSGSVLRVGNGQQAKVIFEDLDLNPRPDPNPATNPADNWAAVLGELLFAGEDFWKTFLKQRLCIVHDDVMTFLARHATDISTRIALEQETKTVKEGQLWTEENLPTETVLVSMIVAMPNQRSATPQQAFDALNALTEHPVQLGGNATVGRGRCRLLLKGDANQGRC